MSNTPLPPQQRAEGIKVLKEEVDQLQRAEEVLVDKGGAERSPNCAPTAVLGVRVADARGVAPRNARSAACACGIRVSQGDAASAFANCGHTVAYVGGR